MALNVVGFGEITLAVAWPSDEPQVVYKRLPPFKDARAAHSFDELLGDYIEQLGARGVKVVPTTLRMVEHERWGVVGYLEQPLIPASRMLASVCRQSDKATVERYLERVIDIVCNVVDARLGLDAQLPNWTLNDDGSLALLDVSTPVMRDADGKDRLPAGIFVGGYPMVVRGPLKRWVVPTLLDVFHAPEGVLLDVATQLLRQDMGAYLPGFVAAVNARSSAVMTEQDVHDNHRQDIRLWRLMQRMRRFEQRWQRSVRRRPYPSLMPPAYDYASDYSPNPRPEDHDR